jgi:A/G-specific adenine glycosylase
MTLRVDYLKEQEQIEMFRANLLGWRKTNKRNFSWRTTHDPFKVLIAEILLHRTKAEQVVPLYQIFLEKYPDIHSIAISSPFEIEETFHSAGLHWRWKLLQSMACEIETKFKGEIPYNIEALISLPGVSHYIGSAVRCFAFGYPDVLLDTNTVRVSGRIFGLIITDSSRRSLKFRNILESLIDIEHPREFNWALIDFAAIVCKSRKPDHPNCPFTNYCKYYTLQV